MLKLSPADCIEKATQQYNTFRPYLASFQITSTNSANRAGAKEKLSRMSNQDFINMSIDIYDELMRRKDGSPDVPFLPVNPNLPANKNGARQKLATLAVSRFHLLCSDVMSEIETRFPIVVQKYEEKYGPDRSNESRILSVEKSRKSPTPKYEEKVRDFSQPHSKSFTPMPRQSSRNAPTPATRQRSTDTPLPSKRDPSKNGSNKGSLDNLMSDLDNMMSFDKESQDLQNSWEQERKQLLAEIADLKDELKDATDKYDSQIGEFQDTINTLREEKQENEMLIEKLTQDLQKLKDDHEWLVEDYENQKTIANDIRAEATNLLGEIKNLSKENDELIEENNQLRQQMEQGESVSKGNAQRVNSPVSQSSGGLVIGKDRVDAFQQSMSEFLSCANVLPAMKAIVISCRNITEDADSFSPASSDLSRQVTDLKERVSDCLGDLMSAAKSHATYKTSSVDLLEDPAHELTNVVFSLVDLLNSLQTSSQAPSDAMSIDDLKVYLENQTDEIVQAIQSLLLAMRKSSTFGPDFITTVHSITDIVYDIADNSHKTMQASRLSSDIKSEGQLVIADLQSASKNLDELGEEMVNGASKTLKQNMASCSYEIAKFVKELVGLIEDGSRE